MPPYFSQHFPAADLPTTRLMQASIGIALALMSLGTASAQTTTSNPTTPNAADIAQEGLRRQEQRLREQQQQLQPTSDVLQPALSTQSNTVLSMESPCFLLQDIRLTGPDQRRFSWLAATAAPFLQRCVGVAGVAQIASVLDAKLIELGYATSRVALPQQNLASGVLEFQLHAGRISEIRVSASSLLNTPVNPSSADNSWGTWRNAFPVSYGDLLNVRDLEQGVEQMKRLSSQTVTTELLPGDAPDTSVLVIQRQSGSLRERLHGGVTLDNSGNELLGAPQFSGYLTIENLLGLTDLLSLSASSNVERLSQSHRSQSVSVNYSIPWGYNTFTFSNGTSHFAQTVQGTTVQFLSSGSSRNTEARWHRTVWRTSASKTGVYASVLLRRANSYLDDVELIVQRRRATNFETGLTYKQLLNDGSFDVELGYRRGVPWQNAQDDLVDAGQGVPTLRPTLWLLSGAYNQSFKAFERPLQYSASLRAQHTSNQTLSIDQIAIGNRFTVRGFDGKNVLLAESGAFLRNELSTPIRAIDGVDLSAFVGLDIGRVWGASAANLIGTKLAGAAIGMRGKWRAVQFDLALGTPLVKPAGFRTGSRNLYLSMTTAF